MGDANYHKVAPLWRAQVEKEAAEAGLLDTPGTASSSVKPSGHEPKDEVPRKTKEPKNRGNMHM
jgi:hypothetical protein